MAAWVTTASSAPAFRAEGRQAIEAVADTPRWTNVAFSKGQIARPQEGLIVIAYHVEASRDDETYEANGTSTYRRLSHEVWRVIQHQQTTPLAKAGVVENAGQRPISRWRPPALSGGIGAEDRYRLSERRQKSKPKAERECERILFHAC